MNSAQWRVLRGSIDQVPWQKTVEEQLKQLNDKMNKMIDKDNNQQTTTPTNNEPVKDYAYYWNLVNRTVWAEDLMRDVPREMRDVDMCVLVMEKWDQWEFVPLEKEREVYKKMKRRGTWNKEWTYAIQN